MAKTLLSRRAFVGGVAAFGAFGFRGGDVPNLKLGVLSDVHVRIGADRRPLGDRVEMLVRAFERFRDEGVDGVVITGDIADFGLTDELQFVADAWRKVFPNNALPNGRPVEKLFIYGNHDWEGAYYNFNFIKQLWPDETERNRHLLRLDYAGHWQRIFGEEYQPIWHKKLKGYDFFGAHWDGKAGFGWRGSSKVEEYFKGLAGQIQSDRPFFYLQHAHPKDTCYGSWVWGHDDGQATRALSAFPNAIALSGHSHSTLTDDRSIWQGAFTSIGTSSLLDNGGVGEEHPPVGRENTRQDIDLLPDCWKYDGKKLMTPRRIDDCKQGAVYRLYDDRLEISRIDFQENLSLGDDWVVPLPTARAKPFGFSARAAKTGRPRFVAGGKLTVTRGKARNRGGKPAKGEGQIPSVEHEVFIVSCPAGVADKKARLYDLEFVAESRTGERQVKYVIAGGFCYAPKSPKAVAPSSCPFALDELPKGDVRFTVTPLNCYGGRGKPLVSEWVRR